LHGEFWKWNLFYKRADVAGTDASPCRSFGKETMNINQGDIYWVSVADDNGAASEIIHPHVVLQDDIINRSRIKTVVVCGITTNMKRISYPGNLLLEVGEANLPKQSIVAVSQISTVNKSDLGDYIGTLSRERIDQIFAGMKFLQTFTESQ